MSRLVAVCCLCLSLLSSGNPGMAQDKITSEYLLPGTTRAWLSVPDSELLLDQLKQTSVGLLSEKEEMKPFVKQIEDQVKSYLDEQNVRLGITIDDLREVKAGEICLAGVLPKLDGAQEKMTRGQHGLVILADVSGSESNAEKLLGKIQEEMKTHGATEDKAEDVLGVKVTKWRLPVKEGQLQRYTYHSLTDGWLVASDNDQIFREVIRRLKTPDRSETADTLANQAAFQKIAQETRLEGVTAHLRWFLDPFGYLELAQAIAEEEQVIKQPRNNHAEILRNEGFDALKGAGGMVSLNVGEQDLVHRTYVHVVKPESSDVNGQRAIGLLDFRNQWDCDFKPESMIGGGSASYVTVTWNMKRAYENIGPIFDAFLNEKSFDKFVESFKKELNVDLGKLISLLGNRITVVSNARRPINERSERVAFLIPILDQADDVAKWIEKLVSGDGEVVTDGDRRYIVISSEEEELDVEDIDPVFDDPAERQEKKEEEAALYLFEKKFILVERGYIIVANDWDYIKELLDGNQGNLGDEEDYQLVAESLNKMIVPERLSAREFGRVDRMLETNYEMLRQGKMAQSQTALARILNRVFKTKDVPENQRKQKIDGSTLPADYSTAVAPYLGPSGWVCETTDDGWLFSGCVLKKKGLAELVKKPVEKQQR
ncbi:MAG: hypothetical protein ACK6DS_19570 [Planctomycetota bacterium]|jgi:hypothetical protein